MARCSLKFTCTLLVWIGMVIFLCLVLNRPRLRRFIVAETAAHGSDLTAIKYAAGPAKPLLAGLAAHAGPRIPHLLHLAFESERVLNAYRLMMASCASRNPEWTLYLWTNEDVELLLHQRQPELLDFYRQLGGQSERLEFAKYPVLFYLGGVILEPDVECLKPLSTVMEAHPTMSAFLSEERPENVMIYQNRPFQLSPAAMGSVAKHEFFAFVVDALLGRVPIENPSLDKNFLTSCYRQWQAEKRSNRSSSLTLLPSELFSPSLRDPQAMHLICRHHLDANISGIYPLRDRGCAMMVTSEGRGSMLEGSVGIHRHLQLEWLTRLNLLLHPSATKSNGSASGDGRFNATQVLRARRYKLNQLWTD